MSAHKCSTLSNHHSAWPPQKSHDVSYLLDTSTGICTYTRHLCVSTHWRSLQLWRKVDQVYKEITLGFAIQVTPHSEWRSLPLPLQCVVRTEVHLASLWRPTAMEESSAFFLKSLAAVSSLQAARTCKPNTDYSGLSMVLGFRGIKKIKDSNCFAQCNKRIPLSEQQGRINSLGGQKKPSHYTVFAVLMLCYKNRTLAYYSWVLLYFTSLYLSSKHNEGEMQCNARTGPSTDNTLTVLHTGVTNQCLCLEKMTSSCPWLTGL